MADYAYVVTVTADTEEQAAQVMAERINVDEDYGFEYTVGFETGRTVTEWGFRHPGFPHVDIAPHVQTSWTGPDGWTTGAYTEENVYFHAGDRPVVKRTRTVFADVVGEWEDICDRHGGTWGDDETCERCTYEDGSVRPLDDKGPLP
jgi:hypothetical protein